ncbi:MAG: DNA polymerase III subunit alpha [Chitinophagaceae bacterium]|nr:DNA polymerase III subunit alpha [Chitinophagaceae bacterium]
MYLNCKTYFSFNYGTFSTKDLVERAVENGVTSLAITNINSTCGAWEFVKLCREHTIKPILGVEIRNGDKFLYLLIAANNKGFAWINRFLSEHLMAKTDFPEPSPDLSFFENGWDGFVIYPHAAKAYKDLRINERIGIRPSEINKLFGTEWREFEDKFVIRQPVTVQDKIHHNLHRLLRAIDMNILLSQLPKEAECGKDEVFIAPAALMEKFLLYPFMISNTYRLMDVCRIEMEFHSDKTKKTYSGSLSGDKLLLRKLALDGLPKRFDKKNNEAIQRLEKELKIIDDLQFNSYFLINYDIIRHAESRGFYHVGRGSGANSIVAYCMGITDVDPIELNLFFERFLNPERTSPPDFDLDFSHTDRDEVMDYIFKRYGDGYVCLLGSYTTYRNDSVIRELGKVFGLPEREIKELQRSHSPQDKIQKTIIDYARLLQDFPNNNSVHACGMLITEEPLYNYCALFMPPKGMPTSQIDMYAAEDIGINKYDILSQRGLGHIRSSLELIKTHHGIDIDIHDTKKFMKDPKVADQIRMADTIGCFYIESPAMRHLLMKLRCDDYLTLVAASSIIRPGVSQSGMMREYIYRYHNRDKVVYLHPLFEEHLSETFGVMVFQEDVIKIAHYFAKLSLGEADILRRAMSTTKYKANNKFEYIREKFFANCKTIGHPDELVTEVWRQMESFAGYSFNKAHSASFAVESYMSLYLKTYYPREFMVAVINNFGGFYRTELYFIELLKTGTAIEAPCINSSDEFTNILNDKVYVGFTHIKGLRKELLEQVLEDRMNHGNFLSLQDFVERIHAGIKQLELLIHVGGFRFTGKTKKQLLWEVHALVKNKQLHSGVALTMFHEPVKELDLPDLSDHPLDDIYDQIENLGFPLGDPFALAAADPAQFTAAKELQLHAGKTVTVLIYFIAHKQVPTKNGEEMYFGTFLDANLDWVDTVHFPDSARAYPIEKDGFYKATGKVTMDFGVVSLEVSKMERVSYRARQYADL